MAEVPARVVKLIEYGDKLWSKRSSLESLWQEEADNFYPERAEFTTQRFLGTEFASNLTTSFPLLCRRELGDTFSGMLRPNKEWFAMHTSREDQEDQPAKAWLESRTRIQRRAMYDIQSKFVEATKLGDHDFATFGQCVIRPQINFRKQCLLYQCIHLKDVVWTENVESDIDCVHRKWKMFACDAIRLFPKTAGEDLQKLAAKTPYEEIELRHIVVPGDNYEAPMGGKPWRTPYVSVIVDVLHRAILEEVGTRRLGYIIPRWQRMGSQYACSPAVVAALPDGRLLQAMTLSLLEASEKGANPPLIAVMQALRSDINTMAGGVTEADIEYDEKLGEVLRPLTQDLRGLPTGLKMAEDIRSILEKAFYLNVLKPFQPTEDPEMTAFQAGQIVQDYIRKALPLFEPMETEYNGALCTDTANLLLHSGTFGSPDDMPPSIKEFIRNGQIKFTFTSPLSQAIDADRGQKLIQAKGLVANVMDVYPAAPGMVQWSEALRDALNGIATPAKWLSSEDQVTSAEKAHAMQQTVGQGLDLAGKAATVGKTLGEAAQANKAGGLAPAGIADTTSVP